MDAHIKMFMQRTIVNFKKAIIENDPKLTWAVINNLLEVLDTYEKAALEEMVDTHKPPRLRKARQSITKTVIDFPQQRKR
jgi:hypothetical protein